MVVSTRLRKATVRANLSKKGLVFVVRAAQASNSTKVRSCFRRPNNYGLLIPSSETNAC
jgi:hypothetical protein